MRKGQFTLEFVGAAVLFLISVLTVAAIGAGELPQFRQDVKDTSLNIEAREITQQLVSSPGYHTNGGGGTDWEASDSNLQNIEEVGLASDYLEIERDKLEKLKDSGTSSLNYSYFKDVTGVENNYRFTFTWLPIIHTSESFTRGYPPSGIQEPTGNEYDSSDNTIHYGSIYLSGETAHALVTAHNGVYDTLFVSESKDFGGSIPRHQGDKSPIGGSAFTVERFQNRGQDIGTSVILSDQVKSFGGVVDRTGKVIKLNRYATLKDPASDDQLLRMEVLVW